MRVKVTEEGLIIPKEWLEGIQEVEIRREDNQMILTLMTVPDPIWDLGSTPLDLDITDASEKHNTYLYEANS